MNKSLKVMLLSLLLVSGAGVNAAAVVTPPTDPAALAGDPSAPKTPPAPATGTFLSSVWEQVWTKRTNPEYVLFFTAMGLASYIAWDKWFNKDATTYEEQDVEDDGSDE